MRQFTDIVFDIDGTLLDTQSIIVRELKKLLSQEYSLEFSDEDFDIVLGVPMKTGLERLGITGELNKKILEEWLYRLDLYEDQYPLMPEAIELLERLKADGYRLGIVTSRNHEGVYDKPSIQPLLPYFDLVITSEETENHKPSGDPLRFYCSHTGAEPRKTMYIGDSIYDMQCANDADCTAVLAGWGAPGEGLEYADVILTTPLSLYEYLES